MKAETAKKRIEGTLKGYFTAEKRHNINGYERRLLDLLKAASLQADYVIREEQMRAENAKKQAEKQTKQARKTEPTKPKETDQFPGDLPEADDNIKIPELDD